MKKESKKISVLILKHLLNHTRILKADIEREKSVLKIDLDGNLQIEK